MKANPNPYHPSLKYLSTIFKRLLLLLMVLFLSRIGLYFFNISLFTGFSSQDLIKALLIGLRFDISVLSMFGAFMILGSCLPFPFRINKVYQSLITVLTLGAFIVAISFNLVDAIYYRFTLKRMTFDIFSYLASMETFWELVPRFLIDFWLVFLMALLLIIALIYAYIKIGFEKKQKPWTLKTYLLNAILFLVMSALTILGMRGGFQLKPINIVDASLHANSRLSPIVLNTPFTIIKSFGQTGLSLKSDFSDQDLEKIYSPLKQYANADLSPAKNMNVVVLILESFSSEHIGFLSHQKTFTPFLDSLFEYSLVFPGIANGKRSIEGIPAILSSLPTLSDESFLNGAYAANQIEGLASSLSAYGYGTAFYHGGKNGTMSFDSYAKSAGFQHYYGRNEYPNEEDYDGHWGIWDELYLQYFGKQLSQTKEPFMSALFTLSSHHPYQIPEKYKGKFPQGKLKIQQAIAYTDHSLKQFFDLARTQDWYQNTIFVITADHTSEGAEANYQNSLGQFSIPIAFFVPADSLLSSRSHKALVQQTDIYPSLMHYLGMEDSFVAFGNSIFEDSSTPFAVNFFNQKFQLMDSSYIYQFQAEELKSVYCYRSDSLLENNLKGEGPFEQQLIFRKAFIQQYNNRMIRNQLRVR